MAGLLRGPGGWGLRRVCGVWALGRRGLRGPRPRACPAWGSACKLTGVSPLPAECNASLCREKPPLCSLGFQVKSEIVPGRCCPLYSCGRWAGPGGSEA